MRDHNSNAFKICNICGQDIEIDRKNYHVYKNAPLCDEDFKIVMQKNKETETKKQKTLN